MDWSRLIGSPGGSPDFSCSWNRRSFPSSLLVTSPRVIKKQLSSSLERVDCSSTKLVIENNAENHGVCFGNNLHNLHSFQVLSRAVSATAIRGL